ncbi:MAG: AI-2E family transporter [Cyclobacteriaceae bacterium]
MTEKAKSILIYTVLIILGLTLLFWGLVQARSFLLPLSVAALLSMIILPVCRWFEKKGINRGWASLFSDLIIILFFVGLASILAAQFDSLEEDWPQIKDQIKPKFTQIQEFVAQKTGLSIEDQQKQFTGSIPGLGSDNQSQQDTTQNRQDQQNAQGQKEQAQQQNQASGGEIGSIVSSASSFVSKIFSILGTMLLIFVYIFFFLLYRRKFKLSILKMVAKERQEQARKVISDSTRVSQKYLFGRITLILFLAVLYSIGLSISGIRNAILISLLAAVLSLLPYIGNIIGYVLAMIMVFISGTGLTGIIGVSITFGITQFVESYVLEPYVVGDKVDLNPVFTIIVVVLGGALWGIVGMLIAIPALGILKVVFDHVKALQPLGYLFGEEDMGNDEQDSDNFFKKTKRWAMNKFHSS